MARPDPEQIMREIERYGHPVTPSVLGIRLARRGTLVGRDSLAAVLEDLRAAGRLDRTTQDGRGGPVYALPGQGKADRFRERQEAARETQEALRAAGIEGEVLPRTSGALLIEIPESDRATLLRLLRQPSQPPSQP